MTAITKHWLANELFARSIERSIDRETLIDLLGIVTYEANRSTALEDAGFSDETPSVECLFDYVLDALGVPSETQSFSRSPFEEIFYNDYWLEKEYASLNEVLIALESLRDEMVTRTELAESNRSKFQVVDPTE